MKLLFDQNISFRVLKLLPDLYKSSKHLNQVQLEGRKDLEIWHYAKKHGYSIVTFDSDFCDIAYLKGHPPKIIWLKIGNTSTQSIAQKLLLKEDIINEFLSDSNKAEWACLEIL